MISFKDMLRMVVANRPQELVNELNLSEVNKISRKLAKRVIASLEGDGELKEVVATDHYETVFIAGEPSTNAPVPKTVRQYIPTRIFLSWGIGNPRRD